MKAQPTMTPEELAAWEPGAGFATFNPVDHGNSRYTQGCRCDLCRTAARAQTRAYRASHREAVNELHRRSYHRRKMERLDLSDVIDLGVAP